MKALVFEAYGGIDMLEMKEVEKPAAGKGEVLVKVRAVSLNDWDLGLISGKPFVNRLECGLTRPKKIQIAGSDIAGTVEALGEGVTAFKVGDEVYGDLSTSWGGFAEYVRAPEKSLFPKPPDMSFAQGAAIPQAGMLAYQGLIDIGKVQPGQDILVNGAGGGVGTIGPQLIGELNCRFTAVDSALKLEMLKDLGYKETMDYKNVDFTTTDKAYDLILDTKTQFSPWKYLKVLKPKGRYVTVGGSIMRLLQLFLLAPWIHAIYKKSFHVVALKVNKDLPFMNTAFGEGKLKPVIHGPFAFGDYKKAFSLYQEGRQLGKIVLVMD